MKLPSHSPHTIPADRNGGTQPRLESDGMDMLQSNPRAGKSSPRLRPMLAFLASAISLTVAGYAQRTEAPLPNAPRPTAVLSNSAQPSYLSKAGEMLAMALPEPAPSDSAATDASTVGDVSLYTVVDLALRNSKNVRMAEAEQQRTQGFSKEMRDVYIPNFSVGSGVGPPSYGFPLGNPTLFSVNSTSLAFSFSQHDYIRSARSATKAATLSLENARQQVILDATLDYVDLDKTLKQIAALNEAAVDTNKLLTVMSDRLNAGLETEIQMTQARLTGAQIKLRTIQMEDHADELREHLSNLTGLASELIVPVAASIPPLPDLDFPSLLRDAKPPAVEAADATADAKMYAAIGDKNQNYRPTVNFSFQYARFATYTGYQQYYQKFNNFNNVEAGIQAVWPLFDPVRKDKAIESKAEANRARRQAEIDRIQNSESNLALWHSLRELEAQEQVADLQQELAQDTLRATVTQMNQGGTNGQPVTPQQADHQRIEERTSYVDLKDAQFNVTKVKLDLLSAVGDLEDWAKESPESPSNAATPNPPSITQ